MQCPGHVCHLLSGAALPLVLIHENLDPLQGLTYNGPFRAIQQTQKLAWGSISMHEASCMLAPLALQPSSVQWLVIMLPGAQRSDRGRQICKNPPIGCCSGAVALWCFCAVALCHCGAVTCTVLLVDAVESVVTVGAGAVGTWGSRAQGLGRCAPHQEPHRQDPRRRHHRPRSPPDCSLRTCCFWSAREACWQAACAVQVCDKKEGSERGTDASMCGSGGVKGKRKANKAAVCSGVLSNAAAPPPHARADDRG
eukprot:1720214-Rhodomonas_salina.1